MKRIHALQRGLGRGYLRSLKATRGAREDLLRCILRDPRWDRQVDERSAYYAQLMLAIEAPWEPLERCLELFAESDSLEHADRSLLLETLAHAAWRGAERARQLLVRYSSSPRLVESIRAATMTAGGPGLLSGVMGPAQLGWLDPTLPEHPSEPKIGPQDRPEDILPLLEQPGQRAQEVLHERADLETLLRYRESAGLHGFLKVMRLLGRRGCGDLIEEAEAALRADEGAVRRRAYVAYLEELPGRLTLERARQWLHDPDLAPAAHRVLRRWAQPDDRESIQQAAYRSLHGGEERAVCDLVEALHLLGLEASVPFLSYAWEEMSFSYGRTFVARALARFRRRPEVAALLEEGLHDSQSGVRQLAAGSTWRPSRLKEMLSDPFEVADVKQAASQAYLAGAPWSAN